LINYLIGHWGTDTLLHRWFHLTQQQTDKAEQYFYRYGKWSLLIVHPISVHYNLNPTRLKAMFHRLIEPTGESSLNISSLEVESTSNDKYLQLLLMAQTN